MRLTGDGQLYFLDGHRSIVAADSIDMDGGFRAARSEKGVDDYINCLYTGGVTYVSIMNSLSARMCPLHRFEVPVWFRGLSANRRVATSLRNTLSATAPVTPVGLKTRANGREPMLLSTHGQNLFWQRV